MSVIKIAARTSLAEVLAWDLKHADTIHLSAKTGFEAGAQGVAVSALAALRRRERLPELECEFLEPQSLSEFKDSALGTAFGFTLIQSLRIRRFQGTAATAALDALAHAAYLSSRGEFGSGSVRSLVCMDPVYPLPPLLGDSVTEPQPSALPPPSAFASLLKSRTRLMGFQILFGSREEADIVQFLYESFRNSLEHGASATLAAAPVSHRVLTMEKIVLTGEADLAARRISDDLKGYLSRVIEATSDVGLGVMCITVSDQGDGIQNTLPPLNAMETSVQRLERAFRTNESRKPSGAIQRGLGLPNVLGAAFRLKALISVVSAQRRLTKDFSLGVDKYPSISGADQFELPATFEGGTSITLLFPEYDSNLDQLPLFGRH